MRPAGSAKRTARPAAPPDAAPAGRVLLDYAIAELAQAMACLASRGGRVHEGVHQARKSLRRTRATLALGGKALGPGTDWLDQSLKGVNLQLSPLRDAHALVETLDRLASKPASDDTAALFSRARRAAAKARAEHARRAWSKDPGFQTTRVTLAMLQASLGALVWQALGVEHITKALQRSASRLAKAGTRARASGDDEDWHRWRRRARRLSQQQRALDGVPLPAKGTRHEDKAIALLLGEAQDYALLRDHCGPDSPFAEHDRQALRKLVERGTRRLRKQVTKAA